MVEETVEDGGSDAAVVVEDRRPQLVGLVGGQDDRASLVALADDLEEEIGTGLVEGQVSKLVHAEQVRGDVLPELGLEPLGGLGGDQVVDGVDRGGEQDGVAALAGLVAQGDRKMGFPESYAAYEHGVGFFVEEAQPEEVLDLGPVDLLRPTPIELVQGLDHREAGGADAPFQGALFAPGAFAFEEALEVLDMGPVLGRGLLGQLFVVGGDIGQAQVVEMGGKSGGFHRVS